jgi:tetratricopeptide (TPR) repeat protein
MTNAEALVGELRKADLEDQETRKLYDRFLPLAINPPYNEKRFALSYARLLFQEKDFLKSIEYFQQVDEKDKNYAEAQYFQLLASSLALGEPKLSAEDHKQMATGILDLVGKIDGFFKSAPDDATKKKYLEWVVVADQIAADQARQSLKDPAKSLQILDGFEDRIKGAKDEKAADLNVMRLRVSDYLAMKKVDDATQTLAKVLKVDPAAGLALLGDVLKAVGHEKDEAQIAGNTAEVKTLAADQAILSGFMLESVEKDPKLADRVASFRLYDANSKREAAELVDDPTARKAGLEAALKQYELLHSQNLDVGTDTAALQGIGLAQYDLGNYADAFKALQPLVDGKKVGNPMEEVIENGVSVTRENTAYWEANYKYYRAALEMFKASPHDKAALDVAQVARRQVVNRFIIFGDKTGGAKYHDDFVKLKDEMGSVLPATATPVKPVAPVVPKKT